MPPAQGVVQTAPTFPTPIATPPIANIVANAAQVAALAAAGTPVAKGTLLIDPTSGLVYGQSDGKGGYVPLDNSVGAVSDAHVFGNVDGTTRQFSFTVGSRTVLRATLVGPGGNGGDGSALHATTFGGGGGGGAAEVLEYATFNVTPGETIYGQIGGSGTGDPTYLKHTSQSGDLLAMITARGKITATVLAGLNGSPGTAGGGGDGAAGVGSFYGRVAAAAKVAPTSTGNGGNGNTLTGTFTANKLLGAVLVSKVGGPGGGAGGYTSIGSAVNGGNSLSLGLVVDGTNGIDGLTGAGGGGAGSTTYAGGGGSVAPICTQFIPASANGGGSTDTQGTDGFSPGCGGGGGATGAYGGKGGPGHIILHDIHISEAPPSRVVYNGAGLVVPSDFVGMHSTLDGHRYGNLTFNTSTNTFTTTSTIADAVQAARLLVMRSGTPPTTAEVGQLKLNTAYYVLNASSPFQLALTDGGAPLDITNAGSSIVGEALDGGVFASFDYSLHRSMSTTSTHWAKLHTGDGTFDSDNVAILTRTRDALAAAGRKMLFTLVGTPNWCASSGPTANVYNTGAQEYPTRSALGDGRIPIRQFVNWLVTFMGPTLAAIELWNEPGTLDGTASGSFKGLATDMVQMAIDIKAELTAMGSSVPLIGIAASLGASSFDQLRVAPNGLNYKFLAANVSGTYGHQVLDGLSLHPYGCPAAPVPPAITNQLAKNDITRIVPQARRLLQHVGAANWSTMPIWLSELSVDNASTHFPSMTKQQLILSQLLGAAASGARAMFHYAFGYTSYPILSRDEVAQTIFGDVKRHIAGKTLTYCASYPDGTWKTTTVEGGTVIWSPTARVVVA